jgi:hypothetical protein
MFMFLLGAYCFASYAAAIYLWGKSVGEPMDLWPRLFSIGCMVLAPISVPVFLLLLMVVYR